MPVAGGEDGETGGAEPFLETAIGGHHDGPFADRDLDDAVVPVARDRGAREFLGERARARRPRCRPFHQPVELPDPGRGDQHPRARY